MLEPRAMRSYTTTESHPNHHNYFFKICIICVCTRLRACTQYICGNQRTTCKISLSIIRVQRNELGSLDSCGLEVRLFRDIVQTTYFGRPCLFSVSCSSTPSSKQLYPWERPGRWLYVLLWRSMPRMAYNIHLMMFQFLYWANRSILIVLLFPFDVLEFDLVLCMSLTSSLILSYTPCHNSKFSNAVRTNQHALYGMPKN